MFRAALVLLAVLAISSVATSAQAQSMPSIPSGSVTITLPSAETASPPAAPANPFRFGSLGLISIRPWYFVVVPQPDRLEAANGALRDRYAIRQRSAVR